MMSVVLIQLLIFLYLPSYLKGLNIPLPGIGQVSYQDGLLRLGFNDVRTKPTLSDIVPPIGTTGPTSSIEIRDTGTIKGYGAFATQPLEEGTFLGFYEGTLIKSREKLDEIVNQRANTLVQNSHRGTARSSSMDYVMSLDGGMTFLDGYDRAIDRFTFSPVHLNHADKGTYECNCIRLLHHHEQPAVDNNEDQIDADIIDKKNENNPYRVAFFTSRHIESNEELCFDYGKNFWSGRELDKI